MKFPVRSACKSRESQGHSSSHFQEYGSYNVHCRRYKIVPYSNNVEDCRDEAQLCNMAIMSLSGEMPQLFNARCLNGEIPAESTVKPNSGYLESAMRNQKITALNTVNIMNCFVTNTQNKQSARSAAESHGTYSNTWGRLSTSMPLFEDEYEPTSARRDLRASLAIGNHLINGNYAEFDQREHILVLRKVPKHCNCACANTDGCEDECQETHEAYFEICSIVGAKLSFTERPSIIQPMNEMDRDNTWSVYQSQHMERLNSNWILLKAHSFILETFLTGDAYFKVVHYPSKKEETRLILSLNGETFYLECVEVGGLLLLVTPLKIVKQDVESNNILSIIGCCRFVHNLVKATPAFSSLSKTATMSLDSVLSSLPVADELIKSFLMNNLDDCMCSHVYMDGGMFSYVENIIWSEFAIRLLRMLPIYATQSPACKKPIQELTMQYLWDTIQKYPEVIDFLPKPMQNLVVVFQLISSLSDVDRKFTDFQEYIDALGDEEFMLACNMKLNLFKIHQRVVLAVCSANEGVQLTYHSLVRKVDSLLFSQMIPSYIFDEMIQYLINKMDENNEDSECYLKCLKFYYASSSFSDVTAKVAHYLRRKEINFSEDIQYHITGSKMFALNTVSGDAVTEELKLRCFDYDIFKLNTKGLTKLRFSYSMNSLLALCRSPMSLHLSFVADKLVATVEGNACVLKVCPKEKEETLRDALSSLFILNNSWHLEVIEKKLARFWGTRSALESITGPPNFHARLWITVEKNNFNQKEVYVDNNESVESDMTEIRRDNETVLQPIEEESYVIINSNVPL